MLFMVAARAESLTLLRSSLDSIQVPSKFHLPRHDLQHNIPRGTPGRSRLVLVCFVMLAYICIIANNGLLCGSEMDLINDDLDDLK